MKAGLDELTIAFAVAHAPDPKGLVALSEAGITSDHIDKDFRNPFGYVLRVYRESGTVPSAQMVQTRYPDVDVSDPPASDELPVIAAELRGRNRWASALHIGADMASRLNDGWDNVDDVVRETVDKYTALLHGTRRSTSWPRLDHAAYHGIAGELVEAVEPYTEADPVAILAHFLVYFGNAAGTNIGGYADSAHHPARVFAMVVGDTSRSRKGTADRVVHRVFHHADAQWLTRKVSGLSSGEGLIDAVRDPDEEADDVEIDPRLLVVEPEFSRTFRVMTRETNPLSAIIREAFDSGNLHVLNVRGNRRQATGAHISILGHITVEEIRALLNSIHIANGFANRFLYVCAKRSQLLPDPAEPDAFDASVKAIGVRAKKALSAIDDRACRACREVGPLPRFRVLRRTTKADAMWRAIYADVNRDVSQGIVGALTARAEAQILRLSVTYALLDGAKRVRTEHLAAAWAFWRYSRDSIAYIWGNSPAGDPNRDRLYAAIVAAGERGLSVNEQRDVFNRNLPAADLQMLRTKLEADGLIVTRRHGQSKGRPRHTSYAVKRGNALTTAGQEGS